MIGGEPDGSPEALILCIEDEADLRADIVEELQEAGYRTLDAGDGAAALALLDQHRPDLILCDITMRGIDGYGVMQQVRLRRPDLADVPFIFLTALAGRADLIQGKNAGADDYLVKPVDYDVMLATIRARLGQVRRMRRSHDAVIAEERRSAAATLSSMLDETVETTGTALDRLGAALVVVDADLRIEHCNAAGTALVEQADAILAREGRLTAPTPNGSRTLRQTIGRVAEGVDADGFLVLERPFRHPVLLHAWPLSRDRARVALLLLDPEAPPALSPETAMKTFGLTPTEARLAVALASGQRLEEIAARSGTAPTTVSFHLGNVFRKTQTTRQSDLVALILRTAVAGRPG